MCHAPAAGARVLGMRLNKSQGSKPKQKIGIGVTVCKCRECGLIFPSPLPKPNSISDHYGVPPESYWSNRYFQIDPGYFEKQIKDAKKLIGFTDGMCALDVGAGIGKCMVALEAAGFECWGIEPSEPFRQKAIERLNIAEDRIALASIEDAKFDDLQFDFITFGAVLEHLYDPAAAIEKSLKLLKKGGVIQIEVPSSDWLIPVFVNRFFSLCGTSYVTNLSPMHPPYHLHEFTEKSFKTHGKRAGYEIAQSYIDICSIPHVPALLKPMFRYWMEKARSDMQLTVWLRKSEL